MSNVINFPIVDFVFKSWNDLPEIAKTPEFEQDSDVTKPEPSRLVVNNEED